jgi:hypothetical protein
MQAIPAATVIVWRDPRNGPELIKYIPAVKIFAHLELDETISFMDGH